MTEAVSQAYATSRVDPDDASRRIYDLPRGTHYSRLMTSIKSAGRSYKNTFQPAREPKRYPTPVTWLLLREKWPARHGKITLLDQGPYRGHKGQAAKCKCRCDCGEVMYIDCGVWVGMSMVKLCPEQCEECRRQGHREISYAAAHSAKRASARAWIGRDITLAKAKRGLR